MHFSLNGKLISFDYPWVFYSPGQADAHLKTSPAPGWRTCPWSCPSACIKANAEAGSLPRPHEGQGPAFQRAERTGGAPLARVLHWAELPGVLQQCLYYIGAETSLLHLHPAGPPSVQSCSPHLPMPPPNARWTHKSNISALISRGQREQA